MWECDVSLLRAFHGLLHDLVTTTTNYNNNDKQWQFAAEIPSSYNHEPEYYCHEWLSPIYHSLYTVHWATIGILYINYTHCYNKYLSMYFIIHLQITFLKKIFEMIFLLFHIIFFVQKLFSIKSILLRIFKFFWHVLVCYF